MCKMCMKHGAAGKWYMNARNYLKETAIETDSHDYLEDLWGNLERSFGRKIYGVLNMRGASRHVNKPIIGKIIKSYANRGFQRDGRYRRINRKATQGHLGQIVTREEAKIILTEKAPIVARAMCPCKYFTRGIKEASCLGFTTLNEILPKLPRFIPEKGVQIMDADQIEIFLDEMSEKGRVNTIWCGPVPAIAALCSCDVASCGALTLSKFGINPCWKGHFVAVVNDDCIQCGKCTNRCQFDALEYIEGKGPAIKPETCFGCGNCVEVCEEKAIRLIDREQLVLARGIY